MPRNLNSCFHLRRGWLFGSHELRRLPNLSVLRWHQIVLAKLRHWEFAGRVRNKMARAVRTRELLFINLLLQRHEGMNERFGTRWTAGNMHIHRDVAVDAFEH